VILAIVLYTAAVTALAAGATWYVAKRRLLIDLPNHRSSHVLPTPRGGGLAIVAAATAGLIALGVDGHPTVIRDPAFLGVLTGGLVAAAGGLADDIRARSYTVKLGVQIAAAGMAVALGLNIDTVYVPGIGAVMLGMLGPALTMLWLVGLTNAYNFMDGIDGLAAGTAVVGAGFLTVVLLTLRQIDESAVASTLAAASLGFLLFNWAPARVFMGDVGSQFVGFVFAALAVLMARHDPSGTLVLVVPLLLFHFIFDTVFTAFRRWRRGENVTVAHRSHLYQRLTHSGFGHGRATTALCAMGVAQGFAALWMVQVPAAMRPAAFVPALAIQIFYALAVTRYEQRVAG
jgi:UDP-GlcNAc:undecaprenyl-phosphate GlcNAc-1-phosphate transferase